MQKATYTPNWSEKACYSKIKNTVPWTYVLQDLNSEKIVSMCYAKELYKTNQTTLRIEKEKRL